MDSLLQSLSQHAPTVLLYLIVAFLVLLCWCISLSVRARRQSARWKGLLDGTRGENLERLLYDHLRERMELQERIEDLQRQVNVLDDRLKSAKRYLGLVRYDAFEDVGGSQSFALALYDERGDGAILTGLIGRADSRVYCKPLVAGRSERSLSAEEQRAVQEALNEGPKTIVSP